MDIHRQLELTKQEREKRKQEKEDLKKLREAQRLQRSKYLPIHMDVLNWYIYPFRDSFVTLLVLFSLLFRTRKRGTNSNERREEEIEGG